MAAPCTALIRRKGHDCAGIIEIELMKEPVYVVYVHDMCTHILSWSKRLECFAKQDQGRARKSS